MSYLRLLLPLLNIILRQLIARSKKPAKKEAARRQRKSVWRRAAPAAPATSHKRASARPFRIARTGFAAALGAAAGAYIITRQRQRQTARLTPVNQPFAPELLEALAAPGGATLKWEDGNLVEPESGRVYITVDGIPDFVDTGGDASSSIAAVYESGGLLLETVDAVEQRIVWPVVWGADRLRLASLAGATAAGVDGGWSLSVPCGSGAYDLETARANPEARIICIDHRWGLLLEARRRALEAGLANLYFVRAHAELLPLQSGVCRAVWTLNGLHGSPDVGLMLAELSRVAGSGAIVAGASLVRGGPRHTEALLRLLTRRLPGVRDPVNHLTLLSAAGLRQLHVERHGGLLSFRGVRR